MAVPKRKTSKRVGPMRRAAWLRVAPSRGSKCPQCGALKFSHRVCMHCGTYKGRAVVKIAADAS